MTSIDPNPANLTDSITVSAQVLPGVDGTGLMPSGTVTFVDTFYFYDYYNNYYAYQFPAGTTGVDENGVATITFTAQYTGSHFVTASYNGDGDFAGSSNAGNFSVQQVPTQLSLTLDTGNPQYGVPFNFNFNVMTNDKTAGTPQGLVYFYDFPPNGNYSFRSGSVDGNGNISFSTADDPNGLNQWIGGSHFVEAYFVDNNTGTYAFTTLYQNLTVNPSSLVQAAVTSAPTAGYGDSGSFVTATVLSCADANPCALTEVPYGVVDFMDGDQVVTSVDLPANGQVSMPTSFLTAGQHDLGVHYRGNPDYAAIDSAQVPETILKGTTSTSMQLAVNQAEFGTSFSMTAFVSQATGGAARPVGTVIFSDGGAGIGQVPVQLDGSATFSAHNLTVGTHAFSAAYAGDTNFASSASLTSPANVVAAGTSTTLWTQDIHFGETATFTATVATQGDNQATPSGLVLFTIDGVSGAPVSLSGGVATYSTSSLQGGAHSAVATFLGNAQFSTSSAQRSQNVYAIDPSVSLSAAPPQVVAGQAVVLTATVSSPAGAPGGTVSFVEGSTLGSATLDAGGHATLSLPSLSAGPHSIIASYSGTASFNGASGGAQLLVNHGSLSMTLSSSANPSAAGQQISITAHLAAIAPASGVATGSVTFSEGERNLGSGSLDSSGNAQISYAPGLGSHQILASYQGDASFDSVSGSLLQTVNPAATLTNLASNLSESVSGQDVTLTANVSATVPNVAAPSGKVAFLDGSVTLGVADLDQNGNATFDTTALQAGKHQLSASYLGTPSASASVSGTLDMQVDQAATSMGLQSSAGESTFGQQITLSANVAIAAPGSGVATGAVEFFDGDTDLGTGHLDKTGTATLQLSSLSAGSHQLTASYEGDSNFTAPDDGSLTQLVDAAQTTVALVSSSNPSVSGQSLMLSANVAPVAPGAGKPSGIVTFNEGEIVLGQASLDNNGAASIAASGLSVGDHLIDVSYQGDGSFNPSFASTLKQTVNLGGVSVALASSGSSVYGGAVTFTANVSAAAPANGVPSGFVVLRDGGQTLQVITLAAGSASFQTSALTAGNHAITASYQGDGNYAGGANGSLTQNVAIAATNATLSAAPSPATFGQAVTLTASLTSPAQGISGQVTFKNDLMTLGSAPVNDDGTATLTTSALAVGTQALTATYSGDNNFAASSATASNVIGKATPSASVLSSAAPAVFGQTITYTALVASDAGKPSGTVTFFDGEKQLGVSAIGSSGQAVFATASLSTGTHAINAVYSGDGSFVTSSGSYSQIVGTDSVAISLTSSQSPLSYGLSVTYTAQVSAGQKGATLPSGGVVFSDGTTVLGTAGLTQGFASLRVDSMSAGSHSISAAYLGDDNFAGGSSSTLLQQVSPAQTSVQLSASAQSTVMGEPILLNASVVSGLGQPSGSVTFSDGSSVLGTVAVDSNGKAQLAVSTLSVTTHALTAAYSGDANFAGSAAAAASVLVAQAPTTMKLISSSTPVGVEQPLTLTAMVKVSSPGAGAPSGTVTFSEGLSTLGIGTVDARGHAVIITNALPAGDHAIFATYNGDQSFLGTASPAIGQSVVKSGATLSLASNAANVTFSSAVTLTAKVSASADLEIPTGTVTFSEGGVSLGSQALDKNANVTLALGLLASGSHTIVADYSGDAIHQASAQASVVQVVTQATTSTALAGSNGSGSLIYTATVSTPATAGSPTGSVSFMDGSTVLFAGTLGADRTVVFQASATTASGRSIVAVYGGDANFGGSTSVGVTQKLAVTSGCSSSSDTTGGLLLLIGLFALTARAFDSKKKRTGVC